MNSYIFLIKVKCLIQLLGKKGDAISFFTLKILFCSQYLFTSKPVVTMVNILAIYAFGHRGRKTARVFLVCEQFCKVFKWYLENNETVVLL